MPQYKQRGRRRGVRALKRRNWINVEIFIKGEDRIIRSQGRKRLKLTPDFNYAKIKIDGRTETFKVYVYVLQDKFQPYIEIPERYFE